MPSRDEVEIKIKLKDSLPAGVRKVKGEFGNTISAMTGATQAENRKLKKAMEALEFRQFNDVGVSGASVPY